MYGSPICTTLQNFSMIGLIVFKLIASDSEGLFHPKRPTEKPFECLHTIVLTIHSADRKQHQIKKCFK